jgi:uncharacterized protein YndB with AHSA1/START domain
MSDTDRIEKQVVLRAPRSRVWRALTDADEFGTWFRAKLENPFREGTIVRGRITYPGYEHLKMELHIERMEPERLFSLRWHPYAVDPDHDYSGEPMTLVEFKLEAAEGGGTLLTIVESGFDQLPPGRRGPRPRLLRRADDAGSQHRAPCLVHVVWIARA